MRARDEYLRIYLNDHAAGAMSGVGLASRIAATHARTSKAAVTADLLDQIRDDRDTLFSIMDRLQIKLKQPRLLGAVIAERLARLKLNGHLISRSPLSSVIEFETLRLGVEGKASGWRALRKMADGDLRLDPAELDELLARAARQSATLEQLRIETASRVFSA
jgi:hypothetical protein